MPMTPPGIETATFRLVALASPPGAPNGIPNSMRILYKTSLLTESLAVLMSIKTDALPHCILFFPPQVFDECRIWSVVELLRRNQH